jgi:cytochrome P450
MRNWLEAQITYRRSEPRDDLLSALVAAEEGGDRLTTNELLMTCQLLLVAGNETTTHLIGNGMIACSAIDCRRRTREQAGPISEPAKLKAIRRHGEQPLREAAHVRLHDAAGVHHDSSG